MNYRGYHFFIGDLELPYAPSELTISIGSNNKTVDLVNGQEINILKSGKLSGIKFDVCLPRGRQYAFANKLVAPEIYTEYFKSIKLNKTPVRLVITRPNPFLKNQNFSSEGYLSGKNTNDFYCTDLLVSLEDYELKESAENAYDIIVSLNFKEYMEYGTLKEIPIEENTNTEEPSTPTPAPTNTKTTTENKTHTVKPGDTLWAISKKHYGSGSYWQTIYNANKTVIENTAKKYGKASSSNGHWIYPGTVLTIPANKS